MWDNSLQIRQIRCHGLVDKAVGMDVITKVVSSPPTRLQFHDSYVESAPHTSESVSVDFQRKKTMRIIR